MGNRDNDVLAEVRMEDGRLVVDAEGPDGRRAAAATVRPRLKHEREAAVLADATRVEASADGGVRVEVPPWTGRRIPQVEVQLQVPAGSRLLAETGHADTLCRGSLGEVDVAASSGSVHVDHAARASVRTASGPVTLFRVDGPLSLQTERGTAIVRDTHGAADLVTGSGELHLWHAHAGVQARSTTGNIRIGVPTGLAVRIEASTRTGRLDVRVPSTAGADTLIEITTLSGDITVEHA